MTEQAAELATMDAGTCPRVHVAECPKYGSAYVHTMIRALWVWYVEAWRREHERRAAC